MADFPYNHDFRLLHVQNSYAFISVILQVPTYYGKFQRLFYTDNCYIAWILHICQYVLFLLLFLRV